MVAQSRVEDSSVLYGLMVERLWFGRHADIRASLTPSLCLNRTPGQDVGNVNFQLGTLVHW
jgi:hypothetical protein